MYLTIKTFLSPVFLVIALLALGLVLLLFRRKETLAKWLLGIALICLCAFSFRPFSNFLLWGLEKEYAPIFDFNESQDINYIVVLTAWDSNIASLPYTSNIGYRSGHRALEAHRIYVHIPNSKIIISGSEVGTQLMRKLLLLLSVPPEKIIIDHSENTYKSAVNVKGIVSDQPFILVTNAIHLPRSMSSFIKQGLRPVPAPADFYYGYYPQFEFPLQRPLCYYVPNIDSFWRSSLAIYEYLGICWYHIKVIGE